MRHKWKMEILLLALLLTVTVSAVATANTGSRTEMYPAPSLQSTQVPGVWAHQDLTIALLGMQGETIQPAACLDTVPVFAINGSTELTFSLKNVDRQDYAIVPMQATISTRPMQMVTGQPYEIILLTLSQEDQFTGAEMYDQQGSVLDSLTVCGKDANPNVLVLPIAIISGIGNDTLGHQLFITGSAYACTGDKQKTEAGAILKCPVLSAVTLDTNSATTLLAVVTSNRQDYHFSL